MLKLTIVDSGLYKTRKTVLEVCREFDIEYTDSLEISLSQCSSCGIWLKPNQFKKDLDNLDICQDCLDYYGP